MINEDKINFRKYFYIAIIISALLITSLICLLCALAMMGGYVDANVIEQSITGRGNLYTRHDSRDTSDLLSIANATVIYNVKRVWEADSNIFSTGVIISGAQSSGGFRNQYKVIAKDDGTGYGHSYMATAIVGDFVGSGEVKINRGKDKNSLDSLILMDSRKGNATFQGRVKHSEDGKPVTDEEMDAVGQFAIRSYLNISEPIMDEKGWLDFCASLDHLIDPGIAKDIYIAPNGYKLDSTGNLVKDENNN